MLISCFPDYQYSNANYNTAANMKLPSFSTVLLALAFALTVDADCTDDYNACINGGHLPITCQNEERVCKLNHM